MSVCLHIHLFVHLDLPFVHLHIYLLETVPCLWPLWSQDICELEWGILWFRGLGGRGLRVALHSEISGMALWDEAGLGPGMESVVMSVGRCSGSCWATAQVGKHPGVGLYPGVVCMPKWYARELQSVSGMGCAHGVARESPGFLSWCF